MNDAPSRSEAAEALPLSLIRDFAAQLRFFSRISVPKLCPSDDPAAPPPFSRSIRMLPPAGIAIWLPAAAVVASSGFTELSSFAVAALAIIVTTFLTGAFHEDGLADVGDGFGGGFTPERRLEIMKDSRIGAFGGIALAAQFVLRTVLVADLVDGAGPSEAALALLGIAAVSRVAPLVLMKSLPPARVDGLGRAAGAPENSSLVVALTFGGLVFVAAAAVATSLVAALLALALTAAAIAVLGGMAKAKIGGFTGDVIGAGTLVAETAMLLGLTAI